MKVTKTEKIWLLIVTVLYLLYNLPGVPPYNEAVPTLVHGALTILPIWVVIYVGMSKVYKIYKLRDEDEAESEDPTC